MTAFKHGDAVKINRPAKKEHGRLARYIETDKMPSFAWVAFNNESPKRLPDVRDLHNQVRCPRKLFPLSQIQPYQAD